MTQNLPPNEHGEPELLPVTQRKLSVIGPTVKRHRSLYYVADFTFTKRIFNQPFAEFRECKFHTRKLGMFFVEKYELELAIDNRCAGAMKTTGVRTCINLCVNVRQPQSG